VTESEVDTEDGEVPEVMVATEATEVPVDTVVMPELVMPELAMRPEVTEAGEEPLPVDTEEPPEDTEDTAVPVDTAAMVEPLAAMEVLVSEEDTVAMGEPVDGLVVPRKDTEDGLREVMVVTTDITSTPPMCHHTHHQYMSDQTLHQFTLAHTSQLCTLDHTFQAFTTEHTLHFTMLDHTCHSCTCHHLSLLCTLDQWAHQCMFHPHQLSTINPQLSTINPMLSDTPRTTTTDTEYQLVEITLDMMVQDTPTLEDRVMEPDTEEYTEETLEDTVVDTEEDTVDTEMLLVMEQQEVPEDGEEKVVMPRVDTEDTVDTEMLVVMEQQESLEDGEEKEDTLNVAMQAVAMKEDTLQEDMEEVMEDMADQPSHSSQNDPSKVSQNLLRQKPRTKDRNDNTTDGIHSQPAYTLDHIPHQSILDLTTHQYTLDPTFPLSTLDPMFHTLTSLLMYQLFM